MQANEESAPPARPQYSALGLGERLRSARKARAMSVAQAAQALKLEEASIVALEEGRFETLGAPVFIRGHLRRYAQLVGLSVEVVLDAYQASLPAGAELPALTRPRESPEQVNLRMWGIWVVVPLLIVVTAVLVLRDRGARQPPAPELPAAVANEAAGPAAEAPAPANPAGGPPGPGTAGASVPPEVPGAADTATAGAAPTGSAGPGQPAAPAEANAGGAAPAARTRLQLRFADDSFASVTDADHRLLSGLQRRGTRQDLAGRPPLRVVLGNARAVSVSVDGKPFRIPGVAMTGNEARFEVGPAGEPPPDTRAE